MENPPPPRYRSEFEDRHGVVEPYLRKFEFEDKEEFDHNPNEEEDLFNVSNPHQAILKYIKEIRESFGFDVDSEVPSWFDGTFCPIDLPSYKLGNAENYANIFKNAEFVVDEINSEMSGKSYKFVDVEKVVFNDVYLSFLTITVKEVGIDDGELTTIQAIVYEDIHDDHVELEQWRIKPVHGA